MNETVVPSGEMEFVQLPKPLVDAVFTDYNRLKVDELNNLHPEAGMPARPPDIAYSIKYDEIEVQERSLPKPLETDGVPPQGSIAPRIIRTEEAFSNLPQEIKPFYSNPDGTRAPEWVQVARMFHRPHKKVAIVGFADTRDQAPYQDPTFEIWGLNDLHNWIPRYDRWFDIHTRDNIDEDVRMGRVTPQARNANIGTADFSHMGLSGLAKVNAPVYMQDRYPDIPNSIKFPLDEMVKEFGNYFTNSISYMIALAVFEGYEEIHVYGVDMAVGTEYVRQRPSVEYFIGIAKGRGIKVYIPPASDLLKTRFMYAFEQTRQSEFDDKVKNMLKNMTERRNQIANQEQMMRDQRNQYEGALGATQEIRKIWSNLAEKDLIINDN